MPALFVEAVYNSVIRKLLYKETISSLGQIFSITCHLLQTMPDVNFDDGPLKEGKEEPETHMEEEEGVTQMEEDTTGVAEEEMVEDMLDTANTDLVTDTMDHSDGAEEPVEIASTDSEEEEKGAGNVPESGDEAGAAVGDDLEEGECSSDEEVPPSPVPPPDPAPAPSKEEEEQEEGRRSQERKSHKNKRSHRSRSKSRSRSRERRHKKKKRKEKIAEEISEEEAKRRAVLKKLKELEANMGLDQEEEYSEEEEEEEEESYSSSSRSRSSSPASPRKRERKRKREKQERERGQKRRKQEERRNHKLHKQKQKSEKPCHAFMAGKCPRTEEECFYSHDADPPQVWELCKFYLFDRCAKRDKCLYLHKGFPCKFFHSGRNCPEDSESCKFSHEPLNDTTRTLLLKHIEAAPKEILGDFQRMTRSEAAHCVFTNEAKNKGWITEGPDAVQPPALEEHVEQEPAPEQEQEQKEKEEAPLAPTHLKLDPIQEKLLKIQGMAGGAGMGMGNGSHNPPLPMGGGRNISEFPPIGGPNGPNGPNGPPPLAVQQALGMEGRGPSQPGPQGHGVRGGAAFNNGPNGPPLPIRQRPSLLGPPPDQVPPPQPWIQGRPPGGPHGPPGVPPPHGPPFPNRPPPGPPGSQDYPPRGPPMDQDYPPRGPPPMDQDYPPRGISMDQDYPPRGPPPMDQEYTSRGPPMDHPHGPPDLMNVPINQETVMGFRNHHHQQSAEGRDGWREGPEGPGPGSGPRVLQAPDLRDGEVPPLPAAQLALYQRIQGKQKERRSRSQDDSMGSKTPGQEDNWYSDEEEQENKQESRKKSPNQSQAPPLGAPFALSNLNLPPELTNVLTAISSGGGSPGQQKRGDPRRTRPEPRRQESRDIEQEEREKDQRLMDLDLGSVFGDLELPPLAPSPPPNKEEENLSLALGLPFKPHIVHVVKEINAGISSHSMIDWVLLPVDVLRAPLDEHKYKFTATQIEADPRLRGKARSEVARIKDLPLPPPAKVDPRLAKVKAQAPAPAVDRRRSSEDGSVYNPAKELTRARQPQAQEGQEGRRSQERRDQEAYSPGYEEEMEERRGPPPRGGGPGYPPPGGQWPQDRREDQYPRGGPRGGQPDGPPNGYQPPYDNYGGPPPDYPSVERGHTNRGPPMDYPQRGPSMDHPPPRGPPMDHPDYYEGPEGWKGGGGRRSQERNDYRGGRGGPGYGQPRRKDPRRRD